MEETNQYCTIAIVQAKANGSIQENIYSGIQYIKQAKKKGADIVLFPECFITSYTFPVNNEQALDVHSQEIQAIRNCAKENHIGVVITAFTKGTQKPRNSAIFIDRDGYILMQYDKVHTCDFSEEACLEHGNKFKVCTFDGICFGIMICYDREYPESARELMLQGAEIILVPNDCGSMKIRLQALSTRAYENMVGVVMANSPGKNAGESCAFSPICWDEIGNCIDNVMVVGDAHTTDIFYATYDLYALRNYREHEMMGNTYRKVEAYEHLCSDEIVYPFIRSS